jgi:hypothetical protein
MIVPRASDEAATEIITRQRLAKRTRNSGIEKSCPYVVGAGRAEVLVML